MKFLRNRSLKQLSILLAFSLFISVAAEILFLKNHFNRIEAIHEQVDFARTAQLTNQRLSLTVDQAIRNPALKSKMLALVDENDFNLNII